MIEWTKKLGDFIEAHVKMLGERFRELPQYQKEQITYRYNICKNTCVAAGKCEHCGCKVPGRLYASRTCNEGKKFPDLMGAGEWERFKKDNNIIFKL